MQSHQGQYGTFYFKRNRHGMGQKTVKGGEKADGEPEVGESYLIDVPKPVNEPLLFLRSPAGNNGIGKTIYFAALVFCSIFLKSLLKNSSSR